MRTTLLLLSQLLFLFSLAQKVEVVTQEKNLGIVSQIQFGNNGRYIASANEKNFQVKVWDVTSSKLIGTLNGHSSSIQSLVFHPGQKQLITSDSKNNVFFWNLDTWQLTDSITHSCAVKFLQVIDNKVIGVSENNEILALNQSKAEILSSTKLTVNAIDADRQFLYLASENELQKFDFSNNTLSTIVTPDKKTEIKFINVSDLFTVTYLANGEVFLYNNKMQLAHEFTTVSNATAVDINSNSKLIAISNRNGEVVLYNFETGQKKATLKDPNSNETIRTLSFNANGSSIATSGYKKLLLNKVYSNNNVIQIWDTQRENIQKVLKGDVNPVEAFAFNPMENHLFSLRGQQLDIWSLNSGERLGTIELHERKLELKDRLADNAEIKKEDTKNEVLGTKVSIGQLSKLGQGGIGSLKNKAANKLAEKAKETKSAAKEETKLSGKAAFSRFGFQEDKIIISPKGNYMLTAFKSDELRLYSLQNGLPEYLDYVKTGQKEFYDIVFDKDEQFVVIGGAGETPISIIPIEEIQNPISKTLEVATESDNKLKGSFQSANALTMTADGKNLVALFNTGRIVVWRTGGWSKTVDINPKATMTRNPFIGFSKDGSKLFVNTGVGVYTYDFSALNKTSNGTAELGDMLSLKKAKINGFPVMTHADMDHLISIDEEHVEFLDVLNDKRTTTPKMSSKLITDIQVNKFGYVGVSLKNGELKIFDPKTGKERFLMVGQDDNAIFKTPNNYYKVTKEGNELVTFRVGSNAYPFEQFDATNNRPDIVLEAMNSENKSLVELYKKAFEKRLSKLGLSTTNTVDLSKLPTGNITNFSAIPLTTDKRTITVNFDASSKSGELSKLIVWNNDVPIFGKTGKVITGNSYNGKLDINLASGNNKIQVAVMDAQGRESLKETIDIECLEKAKPNLYILSIGTSTYKDSRYNLDYAAKDAKDMVSTFKTQNDVYGEVKTKVITNEEATSINISQLKTFFKDAKIDDVVMVFVAGHGLLDANYNYFYGTYDVNFNDPNKKGLAYEKLESLLDGITPLKKILIMDTCHSGEVEEEELLVSEEDESNDDVMFRAVGPALTTIEASPTKMMKELFTDLRRGTGTTVLSSAGGAEFAMESNDWKNGLFTYSLLFGLRNNTADLNNDGVVMLSELQIYVTERVATLSHGKQTPTARIQNIALDYRIW